MNKYLLLRDNKQSGPYSAEELARMGLKAYDLVWQEGKSAAWRYPSEVDELKPFAPFVEEQPFDRFFKKPSEKETSLIDEKQPENIPVVEISPSITEKPSLNTPAVEIPAAKNGKGVYVTFPATAASGSVNKTVNPPGPGSFSATISAPPAKQPSPVTTEEKKKYAPAEKETIFPDAGLFANTNDKKDAKMEAFTGEPQPHSVGTNDKSYMRWIVAACLLLAGIVIGMLATYNTQKKSVRQLNNLVEQIQKRNDDLSVAQRNTGNLIPDANAASDRESNEGMPPVNPNDDSSSPEKSVAQEKKTKTVQNRQAADTAAIVISLPAKNQGTEKMDPASRIQVKEEVNDTDADKNHSKKNLFNLVKIENNQYKTGLLGGISNLQLTLFNKSGLQLENVEVEVHYLSPEKRVVKTQTVSFVNIAPGAQVSLDVPRSNRGVSVDYTIKKINSRGPGIARSGL